MTMPFCNPGITINFMANGLFYFARIRAKTHGATLSRNLFLFVHHINYGFFGSRFSSVDCAFQFLHGTAVFITASAYQGNSKKEGCFRAYALQ